MPYLKDLVRLVALTAASRTIRSYGSSIPSKSTSKTPRRANRTTRNGTLNKAWNVEYNPHVSSHQGI